MQTLYTLSTCFVRSLKHKAAFVLPLFVRLRSVSSI